MRKTKPIAFALLASVFLTSCSATGIPQEKMITTSASALIAIIPRSTHLRRVTLSDQLLI